MVTNIHGLAFEGCEEQEFLLFSFLWIGIK